MVMEKIHTIFIKIYRKWNDPRAGRDPNVYWYVPTSDSNGSSIRYLFDVVGNSKIFILKNT